MFKFLKTILLGLLATTLLSVIAITAQAQEEQPADTARITIPKVPPGHYLYSLKLTLEDLQEKITFNTAKKALLKQEHLRNRINELKYEIYLNQNKNTAKLLQKIQEKRLEIEEHIDNSDLRCQGDISACADNVKKVIESESRGNIEVLNNLLNNPNMPEASRKGLENAINKSGMGIMRKELKANMVQGTFDASPKALTLLPFKSAMVYEPSEQKWYSIVIFSDKVVISAETLNNPDVYVYPTQKQMTKLNKIITGINKHGKITSGDKIELTLLWYQIQKKEGN